MNFSDIKKKIEKDYPSLFPYMLMLQRGSMKLVCDMPQDEFIKGVMKCFKRNLGHSFDINNPVTFNEKLQWYKVFYERDDFGYITDKVTFKDYINKKLGEGYTVPMYGNWDNIDDFERDWASLPEKFVLKSNLAANASAVIVIEQKSKLSFPDVKKRVKHWLKKENTLLNSWDWRFYNSTPKILAEQFMQDEHGELRDYKFFCFDGKVAYFRVDYGRKQQHHATWYDTNKNELDLSVDSFTKDENTKIVLPKTIDTMYSLAMELSKGFPFIRVDLFSCHDKIYLSELTFAPGGGVTPYPDWFDKELGEMFVLPRK